MNTRFAQLRISPRPDAGFNYELLDGQTDDARLIASVNVEALADAMEQGGEALLRSMLPNDDKLEKDVGQFRATMHERWNEEEEVDTRALLHSLGEADSEPEGEYDDNMRRKVDGPASRMKQFMIANDFQEEFDRWAAEVEKAENGVLEITHEEPIVAGGTTMGFMIWYRVAPRPSHGNRPR